MGFSSASASAAPSRPLGLLHRQLARDIAGKIVERVAFEQIEGGVDERKARAAAEQKAALRIRAPTRSGAEQLIQLACLRMASQ